MEKDMAIRREFKSKAFLLFALAIIIEHSTAQTKTGCSSPGRCQNGGTCVEADSGSYCICVNGWSGDDCTENIDDCATAACSAGATCIDRVASFICLCPYGRTGLLCHIDDACIHNPCSNGAQCDTNPINGKAHCDCPSGYRGTYCNEDIDECSLGANPCEQRGKCINTFGSFSCQCPHGSMGSRCEIDINECAPNQTGQNCTQTGCSSPGRCQNGGTCVEADSGSYCICVNGWSGDDCTENIDDCATAACSAGATCIDRVASFICLCPYGRTGLLCHIDDACIHNPCSNGAQCDTNPINGKAHCNCPSGYGGTYCNEDIDECSLGANPCEQRGKCINTFGSFQCQCPHGFMGPRCEAHITFMS
ncbi:hypothetical protein ACEWY4_000495 [Coilia grayii]|uniref:EGF-like domain-containing protein n=1 Tax=Coilia grayii TaxID=363190 RepID=A0ABD1KWS9_9TELE